MRTQDEANCSSLKKPLEEVSDQHALEPQDEGTAAQKRTFTRWMNMFLQKRDPPLQVHDLFKDIQDGRILMALLEELSGCKLLYRFRSPSHHIFRLNNISKALAFLDDRHVKLLGIDASGIADGVPSVVLNLIWNIILHFQVKKVTRGLQRRLSSSLSSLSVSSDPSSSDLSLQPNNIGRYTCSTLPSKWRMAAREPKYHGRAVKTLLQWVQKCTAKFGVDVRDFGKSWRSGLAFLVMIKSINPDLVDLRESLSRGPRENIQQAFMIAQHGLDITPLLEPEDVTCASPDELSIITYVSMFLQRCSDKDEDQILDTGVPESPSFGSLESDSSGDPLPDNTDSQALFRGLEKSSEQLLWKRWSRRSSGGRRASSLHTNQAVTRGNPSTDGNICSSGRSKSITEKSPVSPFNTTRGRCRNVFQPPSPLDAAIVSPGIQSWLEKGSDQIIYKARADESCFSLSSEEGIYSLSALDSDEEEAYSYILDLNKEVFSPVVTRRIPRVKEETAEEMNEESKHVESWEMLNGRGSKLLEGQPVQNTSVDQGSEVGGQSAAQRKNLSGCKDVTTIQAVFDTERVAKCSREVEPEEGSAVREQIHDYRDYGEKEREKKIGNTKLVKRGCEKEEAPSNDAEKIELYREAETPNTVNKEDNLTPTKGCMASHHSDMILEGYRVNENIYEVSRGTVGRDHTEDDDDGKDAATMWTARSPSDEGGFTLQSFAAACDITPFELETLLVLWILLYCCFILPQMNP